MSWLGSPLASPCPEDERAGATLQPGSADKVTAPRDAGTAVFCAGNSMDGSIFFRWRKKQNGCK